MAAIRPLFPLSLGPATRATREARWSAGAWSGRLPLRSPCCSRQALRPRPRPPRPAVCFGRVARLWRAVASLPPRPGRRHLFNALDTIWIFGYNGRHGCQPRRRRRTLNDADWTARVGPTYRTAPVSFFAERYRSGRNGGASKASCRVTGTWVRIPPSPPLPPCSSFPPLDPDRCHALRRARRPAPRPPLPTRRNRFLRGTAGRRS